jgi:hypothetical protein
MAIEFTVSDVIPASPQEIYAAWLSSEGHAQITGGQPAEVHPKLEPPIRHGMATLRERT